jgi:hypothetical protein
LKGQGPEVASVKPQPASPLRLSVETYWLALKVKTGWSLDPNAYEIATSVENVSDRAVSAFAIRHAPGDEIPGLCVRRPKPPHGALRPGEQRPRPPVGGLPPGESDVTSTWRGFSPSDPVLTYEVDFVEFTDGATWGADVCRSAERLAGERAGARAAAGRLLGLLAGDGPDAVTKAVKEELAGWGPEALLKAAKEGVSDIAPPAGHSRVWELGFLIGTKAIAERVRWAGAEFGPGEIEHALSRPYDAAGAK